jgi:putative nucleotidyltransferase with HDIG domain
MIEAAITPEKRLKRVQRHIEQMPSLSTTVTKVLEICDSPTTSPNDLNRVISLDPVLVGQVLRLINSAYYSMPEQITSLTRAIIMLGLNTVKNLALSTAVLERLASETSFQALSMNDFWTHSICVGVTAKSIATVKGVPGTEREEYFVAGLLHDLGKIPLNDRFPEEYVQALESAKPGQCTLRQAENMVFGIDHCVVGRMIAGKWRLSEAMNDSLGCHHNPDEAEEETRQLVEIVALANAYANTFAIGSSGDPFPEKPMVTSLIERVGVSWSTLSDLRETVLEEIEQAKIFLRITQKGQANED